MKRSALGLGMSYVLLATLAGGCAGEGDTESVGATKQSLCSGVLVTSDDADYSVAPGPTVRWTAAGSCTGTPQYIFWLLNPNGTWTLVQDWSAVGFYDWNTSGLPNGLYQMQVWVRDANGWPNQFDAYGYHYFTLANSPPCSSASSVRNPTSGAVGTPVQFTNSAGPCTTPEFQIWHLPPGGSWQLESNYATSNATYNWVTTGQPTGLHYFQIWTRQQGSTRSYEAYTSFTYNMSTASPCTSAGLSFAPVGHAAVGANVTLTASAGSCGTPNYRYFIAPPGGAYQELQGWTASPTVQWNTTLAAAGTYNFQVWVRASDSSAAYEAYIGRTYTLDAVASTASLSISGGWEHNCQLTSAGKVGCWGYNAHGELGAGISDAYAVSPVAVSGVTQGISLGSGYAHSCAVVAGGTVKCWGQNTSGQLGNGTTADSSTPVNVAGITSGARVAGGTAHTCLALADGSVRCWGYNSQGQLGNGNRANSSTPVAVSSLGGNATQISAGYYHSCALLSGGTVRCWGLNGDGQLGDGTNTNSLTPVTVSGLTGVTAISSDGSNSCALKSDGTIWCWGQNTSFGTLGSGSTTPQSTPVQIPGITTAKSVAVGIYHGCAALQDNTATCWGSNVYGQLGNATNTDSLAPVPVSNLTTITSVGVANYASCALLADGTAACWGYNGLGALGNGSTQHSNVPVVVGAIP